MGGSQSKAQEPQDTGDLKPEDENHYFVQEIAKVSLKNCKQVSYYWIDPKVYNAENQKYYNQYLQNFKIDSFTSLEGLKSELEEIENQELIKVITAASLPDDDYRHLQNQKKVAQIFLFCGNEERAKLLSKNFSKIKGYGLKCPLVIEVLKKAELEDQLEIPPCSLLSMLEEDRKMLNKYRLNYFCITTKHPKTKSKEDFINLANALYPEQKQKIVQFQRDYNIDLKGSELYDQVLSWAMDDSFYWKLVQNLPKATVDPKKLAYLRLPFSDLFQSIFKKHKQMQKIPEELYIVVQLSAQQILKIQSNDSLDNFIIFTSFIKGYTKKADAIKDLKQTERSFLFSVNFTHKQREKELDFGFYINNDSTMKKNVIFNIYNFFQLQSIQAATRSGTLIYGPLTEAYHNRADKNTKKRLTDKESILLRNYDYLEDLIKKDDSQAVILQMSGYFKESLIVYDRKVEYLKKTKAPENILNKYIILRGDAYRINQDYEQAENQYRSIKSQPQNLVGFVHLLQLFLKKGDDKRAQEVQEDIQYASNMRKLKQKYPEQAFKAQNFIALSWMKQGRYKQALKKYKNLQAQTSIHYNYRFQGIPLVHDIFRNMATCESKLNNHKEALNLLNSTKDWQLVCEGQSAGLALTQTMIHHVYQDMGNKESARATADVLVQLRQTIGLSEKRYLDQSMVAISMGLNKPIIKQSSVVFNMNPQGIQQRTVNVNMNPNVNQSAVNINLNPNLNVNQSRVDVNLNDPKQDNFVIKQSSIQINVNDPKNKQTMNINNSSVDIKF